MGCGCGGSTRREVQPAERDGVTPPSPRRVGGPGEAGYYWTGPKRGAKNWIFTSRLVRAWGTLSSSSMV